MQLYEAKLANSSTGPAAAFTDYFRCPPAFAPFSVSGTLAREPIFFAFDAAKCFGRTVDSQANFSSTQAETPLCEIDEINCTNRILLPFDATEVMENLRREYYLSTTNNDRMLRRLYYTVRPAIAAPLRKLIQRIIARSRLASSFPCWPVDCSVDVLAQALMAQAIAGDGEGEIPFIWFWPEGYDCAVVMTHDVEDRIGRDHCSALMDLDDSFGIKAAFQIIPEGRYGGVEDLIHEIQARGFEANIHDLDHDGRLYLDRDKFEQRAKKINEYGVRYGLKGFRAGAMYRQQDWFSLLDFEYEMSVPNAAHLEPQQGGCCTVMPYFVGKLLEIPLTTVQDHSLFYILRQRSIELWKRQIELIRAHHGVASFIVHPDYIVDERERDIYRQLLEHIARQKRDNNLWIATPGELNCWWRQRHGLTLVRDGSGWRIAGEGNQRARLAFASLKNGKLFYRISPSSPRVWPESVEYGATLTTTDAQQ